MYGKAFFHLQVRFARKVTALSGLPLELALLQYTNLYVRLGLGRAFDPGHPIWREYAAGLGDADDIGEWTYRFYLTRRETEPPGASGCTSGVPRAMGAPRSGSNAGISGVRSWPPSSSICIARRIGWCR